MGVDHPERPANESDWLNIVLSLAGALERDELRIGGGARDRSVSESDHQVSSEPWPAGAQPQVEMRPQESQAVIGRRIVKRTARPTRYQLPRRGGLSSWRAADRHSDHCKPVSVASAIA